MAIPRETVEQILQAAHIEEVVGEFVTLKKKGSNLWGNCPFHNEKTPSFSVNPARNIFKCFGCGKAGDSAKFLMEHEHYTYPEALRYLAMKYNIKIEEKQQTAEEIMQQSRSSTSATTPPNGMPSPNTPRKTAIAKSFWSR